MHMIRHEVIPLHRQAEPDGLLGEQTQIYPVVILDKEGVLAIVFRSATLTTGPPHNMVRAGRNDDPSRAWHAHILSEPR